MSNVVFGHRYVLTVSADGKPERVTVAVMFRLRNQKIQVAATYPLSGDGVFQLDIEKLNRGKTVLDAIISLPIKE